MPRLFLAVVLAALSLVAAVGVVAADTCTGNRIGSYTPAVPNRPSIVAVAFSDSL
jgi:hypothetical protein